MHNAHIRRLHMKLIFYAKIFTLCMRGRRRGTHRCVLDNFDSGPHCRAEQSGAANPAWQQLPLAAAATSHPDPCAESRGPLKSLPFCGFVYFIAA